jgi:acetyl esterase/lipase
MKLEQIHPELRERFRYFPTLPFHNRFFLWLINLLMKGLPKATSSTGLLIEERKLVNAAIRIYKPEAFLSGAGLLWMHGGGFITGNNIQDDNVCMAYAQDLNLVVVSVEYRLAPSFPFPAAIDDCYEVWLWMQENAQELGIDPSRIVISGVSAGGGLAASLTQKILDEGGVQPAAQTLFSPMLDDRTSLRHELDSANHPVWNNKSNRAAWTWYLGQPAGGALVPPYAVPARRENLSGLPEAWIAIGDIDLFYEEVVLYAERLNRAGVNCELYVTPMAPHGFEYVQKKAKLTRKLYEENYRFFRMGLGI